jgi:hypothetical protein
MLSMLLQGIDMSTAGVPVADTAAVSSSSAQQIMAFLANRELSVPAGLQALAASKMRLHLKPYQLQTLAFMMGECSCLLV